MIQRPRLLVAALGLSIVVPYLKHALLPATNCSEVGYRCCRHPCESFAAIAACF
ncbi:MAG: hypothetical protein M3247_06030 [Thermoproteota archaeon]|nr:hypothetical protein [Thermoproteota archaeon]